MTKMNLKLRTKILEKALELEYVVNELLLEYFAIMDKSKTKNFGNKAGIPFQSKIDLLYDLDILSKSEHFNLGLQMVFRNKFLHDKDYNSFEHCLENIDKSIIKKVKIQCEIKKEESESKHLENAYFILCEKNANLILDKWKKRNEDVSKRVEFTIAYSENYHKVLNLVRDGVNEILSLIDKIDKNNYNVINIRSKLINLAKDQNKAAKLVHEEYKLESEKLYSTEILKQLIKQNFTQILNKFHFYPTINITKNTRNFLSKIISEKKKERINYISNFKN